MSLIEVVILTIVILVSITLLCLFLDKIFRSKKETTKQTKPVVTTPLVETPTPENEEKVVEPVKEVKPEIKSDENMPEVSVALQNDLKDFQEYLKSRITSYNPNVQYGNVNSANAPAKSHLDYDKEFENFQDITLPSDFTPRRPVSERKGHTDFQNLPNDVKILLMSHFFDSKF